MKPSKSCANCIKSRAIPFSNDVLCITKGVVSADFVCRRHKFIPDLKSAKEANYKCTDCANFIVHEMKIDSRQMTGLCKLFSARYYDGNKKKACSKFLMKYEVKQAVLNGTR
ncbi:MAG: hypothetical protein GX754_11340 [Clostridiaceae bacterium]|nr:hypothetical protein [Clostridiaceae bacterium]